MDKQATKFFYTNKNILDSIMLHQITSKPYFEIDNEFPGYENLSKSYIELKKI